MARDSTQSLGREVAGCPTRSSATGSLRGLKPVSCTVRQICPGFYATALMRLCGCGSAVSVQYTTLHSRTAYDDWPELKRRRKDRSVRLWQSTAVAVRAGSMPTPTCAVRRRLSHGSRATSSGHWPTSVTSVGGV